MRIASIVPFLLLPLAGCQAEQDPTNNQVTVQYNAEVAENALEDVANEATRIGGTIVNDVQREGDRAGTAGADSNRVDGQEQPANAN
ncbi:MAG TPA: hypothetical protein VM346_07715 [Sphingomicrobium sp.]|nr:hypothetical protein [Sphingomicrobium sp.]